MAKTILIAEDIESDAALLQQTLSAAGIANPVVVVTDGYEVLAYFLGEGNFANREKYPLPAVLLLDLKMPRMNGFQVLEWLRKRPEFKRLLIVVLTGSQERSEVGKAYQLGANTFLTKPCTTEDIHNLHEGFAGYWESSLPANPGDGEAHISWRK